MDIRPSIFEGSTSRGNACTESCGSITIGPKHNSFSVYRDSQDPFALVLVSYADFGASNAQAMCSRSHEFGVRPCGSVGKSRKDFQSHRRKTSAPSSIVNSHLSSGTSGVGPADKTGKSVVRYCPGGSFGSKALRLPEKPREMIPISTSPPAKW